MQYVEFYLIKPTTGAALPGGKVTVYLAGTTTPATLFNAAGTGIANPAIADVNGLVGFAAANGSYDYSGTSSDGSYVVPTIHRQQFYDLSGLDAQVTAAQTAATTAQASANAVAGPIYGMGAPDATVPGPEGATYYDYTSGRQYGPRTGGVWPKRFTQSDVIGTGYEDAALIVMAGQSQNEGYATDYKSSTAVTPGYGYEYYFDTGSRGTILPLGFVRLGRKFAGPQAAFAQAWAAGGGGAAIICKGASGGSSVTTGARTTLTGAPSIAALSGGTWDLSDPANVYVNYFRPHWQRALSDCLRQGFNINALVIDWNQGEQDALANVGTSAYQTALAALFRQIHIDFPTAKIVICELGNNQAASNVAASNLIRAGQNAVATTAEFTPYVAMGCTDSKTYTNAGGYYSDTLHYSTLGANNNGNKDAVAALNFAGMSGIYPVPDGTKYADLLTRMPCPTGWYRMALKTKANGAWQVNFYSGPLTPFSVTLYDVQGPNSVDTAQSISWSYPSGVEKTVYVYAHKSTGAALLFNAFSGNANISGLTVIDEGFPLNIMSFGGAEILSVCNLKDSDLYRFSKAKFASMAVDASSGTVSHTFTNLTLGKLNGITAITVNRSPGVVNLDLTLVPNITTFNQTISNFTSAQVNALLRALVINGKSNGNANIAQYCVANPVSASAPPTGQGATDKATLISRGWTVQTD